MNRKNKISTGKLTFDRKKGKFYKAPGSSGGRR